MFKITRFFKIMGFFTSMTSLEKSFSKSPNFTNPEFCMDKSRMLQFSESRVIFKNHAFFPKSRVFFTLMTSLEKSRFFQKPEFYKSPFFSEIWVFYTPIPEFYKSRILHGQIPNVAIFGIPGYFQKSPVFSKIPGFFHLNDVIGEIPVFSKTRILQIPIFFRNLGFLHP